MREYNNTKIINKSIKNFNNIRLVFVLSIFILLFSILTTIYYTIEGRKYLLSNNEIKEKLAKLDNEIAEEKELAMLEIFNSGSKHNKYYVARELDSKYAFVYEQRI
ncbi:MAG: hypothetical protein QM532_01030 [Cyanobium sp. MAG06]|nr:hypothetical protein [Cyanobium sp. MAG06]